MPDENPAETRARARLGHTLCGKYRLDSVLGVGGMAAVYAGVHRNGRPVAVKVLHPELTLHEGIRERFLREGQVANAVGHPGAVAVIDDDVAEDGSAFLVMELLDGRTIESLSERARLPLEAVCSLGLQVLEVLEAAHASGVVHRDIKPANLFVTRDGAVKVLDFGIARLREPGTSSATQTGLMLGTPAFMAPEQAIGRMSQIDARTDLWALGATLFTLISGQPVHEAESVQEALVKAATEPVRSLRVAAPKTPKWFSAVVDRALAFEQNARFATASEMRAALAAGARDATPEALATLVWQMDATPGAPSARRGRSSTHAAVVTAAPVTKRSRSGRWVVVLALLGAGVAFAKWRHLLGLDGWFEPAVSALSPDAADSIARRTEGPEPPSASVAQASSSAPEANAPAPGKSAAASRRRAPAASATLSSAPPASPSVRSCDPPYRLDASGVKIWKRECF